MYAHFPKWKTSFHILSSIFFPLNDFRNIVRSFFLDFCFLIFLILVCALTWVLNYSIFGEKHLKAYCRFWSHSKCSFLELANCYLDSNGKLLSQAIRSHGCQAWLDSASQWAMWIIYLPWKRNLFVLGLSCQHSITSQAPNTAEALTRQSSNQLRPEISLLFQSALAVCISSILNYHTCHLDPGRMNVTSHIMLQNHFLSKYPLADNRSTKNKKGKRQLRASEGNSVLRWVR